MPLKRKTVVYHANKRRTQKPKVTDHNDLDEWDIKPRDVNIPSEPESDTRADHFSVDAFRKWKEGKRQQSRAASPAVSPQQNTSYLKPRPSRRIIESSPESLPDCFSPFPSSQVIASTGPHNNNNNNNNNTLQDTKHSSSPVFVDDAAAPNLSQKHSQYLDSAQDVLSSRSAFGTTATDIVITSSSSVHTLISLPPFVPASAVPQTQPAHDTAAATSSNTQSGPAPSPSNASASNTLPLPPSQLVNTLASVPQRPDTPSTISEDQTQDLDLGARLREIRLARKAAILGRKPPASNQSTVASHPQPPKQSLSEVVAPEKPTVVQLSPSPSTIPYAKPIPPNEQADNICITLSSADAQQDLSTQSEDAPKALTSDSTLTPIAATPDPRAHPNEFTIPIYFSSRQRDDYKHVIVQEQKFIDQFAQKVWTDDSDMAERARTFIKTLVDVTQHPDLANDTLSQPSDGDDAKAQANWDVDSSAKIRFLFALLTEITHHKLHIVVVVGDTRMMSIVDTFLRGKVIPHRKATDAALPNEDIAVTNVTIFHHEDHTSAVAHADVVIVIEGSVSLPFKAIRKRHDGSLSPLFRLIVPRSVEHINRELKPLPSGPRMNVLVDAVARFRHVAGRPDERSLNARDSGVAIARFIKHGGPDWSMMPLGNLPDIVFAFLSQRTDDGFDDTALTTKRTLIDTDDTHVAETQSKKPRLDDNDMSPQRTQVMETTHVSDSVETWTQSGAGPTASSSPLKPTQDIETLGRELESIKIKNLALEQRVTEQAAAMERLQYRYEDLMVQIVNTRKQREEALASIESGSKKVASQTVRIAELRVERDKFKQELSDARAALLNHEIPDRREIEELRQTAAQHEAESMRLGSRTKSLSDDLDYIRNLYQEVSGKGAELATENSDLETQVSQLQQKAAGEAAKATQLSMANFDTALMSENFRLRALLQDREATLSIAQRELAKIREVQLGRIGTRGTSTPRSVPAVAGNRAVREESVSHSPLRQVEQGSTIRS